MLAGDCRVARLVALADANPEHTLAYVRHNDCIFLNPEAVSDLKAPLSEQLGHFLEQTPATAATLDDIERALRTGVCEGAAAGDSGASDGEMLDEAWREDSLGAWAALLRSRSCGSMVMTEDGRCAGPLPITEWLDSHLEPTLALVACAGAEGGGLADGGSDGAQQPPAPPSRPLLSSVERACSGLAEAVAASSPPAAARADHLSRLLLALHLHGELLAAGEAGVAAGEGRPASVDALAAALAGARRLWEEAGAGAGAGAGAEAEAEAGLHRFFVESGSLKAGPTARACRLAHFFRSWSLLQASLALEAACTDERRVALGALRSLAFIASAIAEQRNAAARRDKARASAATCPAIVAS